MADEKTKDASKDGVATPAKGMEQLSDDIRARILKMAQEKLASRIPAFKQGPSGEAAGIEITDADKERLIKMAKEKVAGDMLPALKDARTRTRTAVAVRVLAIVEREIGKGEGPLPEEWAKLKEMVAHRPEAVAMVERLQEAMRGYAEDLERKVKAGDVDAEAARQQTLNVIRMALLKKIQIGRSTVPEEQR